ncbi:hypothetical protein KIPB_008867, partial [Kipferlia bialata]
VTDEDFAMML